MGSSILRMEPVFDGFCFRDPYDLGTRGRTHLDSSVWQSKRYKIRKRLWIGINKGFDWTEL